MLVTEAPDTTGVNFTVNATKCTVNNLYIASHLNCMNLVMLNKSNFKAQVLIFYGQVQFTNTGTENSSTWDECVRRSESVFCVGFWFACCSMISSACIVAYHNPYIACIWLTFPYNSLFGAQAVFLYCSPDCPSCLDHLNSISWTALAIWAAVQKYSLISFCFLMKLQFVSVCFHSS